MIISNAGPLISLSKINKFELLKKLYGKINISPSVYDEVVKKGRKRTGEKEVEKAIEEGWIKVIVPKDLLAVKVQESMLGNGEAESIILSQELKADVLLIDEKKGRIAAQLMGIKIIGTIGILMDFKKKVGEIDLKKTIDELRKKGFRLEEKVYQSILKENI